MFAFNALSLKGNPFSCLTDCTDSSMSRTSIYQRGSQRVKKEIEETAEVMKIANSIIKVGLLSTKRPVCKRVSITIFF